MEKRKDYKYLNADRMVTITLADQSSADHTSIL
jgi:hypothetical protein